MVHILGRSPLVHTKRLSEHSLSLHASLREVLEVQMAAVSSAVHSATCGTQEVMFGDQPSHSIGFTL